MQREQTQETGLSSEPDNQKGSKIEPQDLSQGALDAAIKLQQLMLLQNLAYVIGVIVIVVIAAHIYRHNKVDPKPGDIPQDGFVHTKELVERQWRYGLFDCFADFNICCIGWCCSAVRWADTMRMAGFLTFWLALAMWLGVIAVQLIVPGAGLLICLSGMFYRQKLREKFDNNPGTCRTWCEDCLTWWCCPCCALIQEARHVEEAYIVGHPCILSESQPLQ